MIALQDEFYQDSSPDALSVVRDYLSRHPQCQEWDTHDLAQALGLCEMEVQFALEALTTEDRLLP